MRRSGDGHESEEYLQGSEKIGLSEVFLSFAVALHVVTKDEDPTIIIVLLFVSLKILVNFTLSDPLIVKQNNIIAL